MSQGAQCTLGQKSLKACRILQFVESFFTLDSALDGSSILEPPVRYGSNFAYNYKEAKVAIRHCRNAPNSLPTRLLWFETLFHNIITINTEQV